MKKLAVPLILIFVGLAALLVMGILDGGIPEIQAMEMSNQKYHSGTVKVHGVLGKIESAERPLRFWVKDKAHPDVQFPVIADKTRPDTFQETYDVAVEGRWDSEKNRFEADRILTKCPSKYEAESKDGIGSQAEYEKRKGKTAEGQVPAEHVK